MKESVCGKCGYIVTGLPTFICPECGGDLREVGIRTLRRWRIGQHCPALLIAAWTILCILAWYFGSKLLNDYAWPYQMRQSSSVELTPRSGDYRKMTISEERSRSFLGQKHAAGPWNDWKLHLRLDKSITREGNMEMEPLKNLAWSYTASDGKVRSGTMLDVPAMWGWMMDSGADAPSPAVKDEAEALVTLANTAAADTSPASGNHLERLTLSLLTPNPDAYAFSDAKAVTTSAYTIPRFSIHWLTIPVISAIWAFGAWRLRPSARRAAAGHRVLSILFTDIKDYTKRTESASRAQLVELLALNRQLVEAAVNERNGKVVKSIGDALLATFESATNAILAGLEIQRRVRDHNARAAANQKLELRVAVSTGEVVTTHGDVFGTAVNIASRVQNLANPGEVYFTESTYHAMIGAEVGFVEIGQRELKGINHPVKVFRAVEMPAE